MNEENRQEIGLFLEELGEVLGEMKNKNGKECSIKIEELSFCDSEVRKDDQMMIRVNISKGRKK